MNCWLPECQKTGRQEETKREDAGEHEAAFAPKEKPVKPVTEIPGGFFDALLSDWFYIFPSSWRGSVHFFCPRIASRIRTISPTRLKGVIKYSPSV